MKKLETKPKKETIDKLLAKTKGGNLVTNPEEYPSESVFYIIGDKEAPKALAILNGDKLELLLGYSGNGTKLLKKLQLLNEKLVVDVMSKSLISYYESMGFNVERLILNTVTRMVY